jgi:peptidoglycan/xylan/chitin deacetylase (PgdA/CDA1 family)
VAKLNDLKKIFLLIFVAVVCACSSVKGISIDPKNGNTYQADSSNNEISAESTFVFQQPVATPTQIHGLQQNNETKQTTIRRGPGGVDVPILLYHHVTEGKPSNSYSISKENFKKQLDYLVQNGYRTISMNALVQAITNGTDLPEKPIIITFDDGNQNVFFNAFPIMEEKGLTGMVFIIANRINAEGFLSARQLTEMISAGWEVGSHGMRHVDLVKQPQALRDEIGNSKKFIENALNINIYSFAYPYGKANKVTIDWVKQIGYSSALGLGITNHHDMENIFYLSRREVKNDLSMLDFQKLIDSN